MARATLAASAVFAAFAYGGAAAPGDPELALVGTFSSPTYLMAPRRATASASSSFSRAAGSGSFATA